MPSCHCQLCGEKNRFDDVPEDGLIKCEMCRKKSLAPLGLFSFSTRKAVIRAVRDGDAPEAGLTRDEIKAREKERQWRKLANLLPWPFSVVGHFPVVRNVLVLLVVATPVFLLALAITAGVMYASNPKHTKAVCLQAVKDFFEIKTIIENGGEFEGDGETVRFAETVRFWVSEDHAENDLKTLHGWLAESIGGWTRWPVSGQDRATHQAAPGTYSDGFLYQISIPEDVDAEAFDLRGQLETILGPEKVYIVRG